MIPAERRTEMSVTAELMHAVLLRTADFPGADFRILSYYMTYQVRLGDTVRVSAKDIAQQLGLSPGSVSKGIKRLRDAGWLELVYTVGRLSFYRIGSRVWDLADTEDQDEDQALAPVHHLRPRGGYAEE